MFMVYMYMGHMFKIHRKLIMLVYRNGVGKLGLGEGIVGRYNSSTQKHLVF